MQMLFLFFQIWPGLARPGQAWPEARPGPGPAGPGLAKGLRFRNGAQVHENQLFIEKRCFRPILVISGTSRPQNQIELEILHRKMVSGGLDDENTSILFKKKT